jgi:hypothetical protein
MSSVCESTVKRWFKKVGTRIREYIAPFISLRTFYDHSNTYDIDVCHIYTYKNH